MAGATAFKARVVSGGPGGQIQIRTGSQTGPILGTVAVPNTGSWTTFADVIASLSGVPNGHRQHLPDLHAAPGTGLFDVDDFTFVRSCTPTVTNLALNKPATASSVEAAQYPASAAVDSSATTRWASAFADPQWIQVDLGQTYTINRVRLLWEAAYGSAYQIQTSPNGTTWTTVRTVTGGNGGEDDNTGLNNAARYVRIYGTARGTAWGYSLFQFEVYGSWRHRERPIALVAVGLFRSMPFLHITADRATCSAAGPAGRNRLVGVTFSMAVDEAERQPAPSPVQQGACELQ